MKYILFCLLMIQLCYSQEESMVDVGQHLIYENKLEEAIIHYNKNLDQLINDETEINILLGLAEIYKLKLNYNKSNDYYSKAYVLIKKSKNIQLKFLYHVKMAEFYRKRSIFKEAVSQLKLAEIILRKSEIDELIVSKFYNRKAALFSEYFRIPDSTLFYAKKSLEISEKINDIDNVFYSTLEISGVHEQREEYNESIRYLEGLILFSNKNNLYQQQVDAYINYTRVLIKSNQLNKALTQSLKALDFAKERKILFAEILFLDNISEVYNRLNNPKKAHEYLKIRLKLTDEYYKLEHDKFLFELEEKYKLSEKDNQIKIKNLEIVNTNKALESSTIKLYVSIALFLLAISIAFLIGYFLKQTRQKNSQLRALSQENKFLVSEANHRINNNLQLIIILIYDQLKKLPANQQVELNTILKKIDSIATLHRHLYKNQDKNEIHGQGYLKEITINFNDLFKENNIETEINIDSFMISTDVAMYLGLIFTELCINSIKHAFVNKEFKQIKFDLKVIDHELVFHYSDNGIHNSNKSIHPKLLDKLCLQLKVDYEINTVNGFAFSFKHTIN